MNYIRTRAYLLYELNSRLFVLKLTWKKLYVFTKDFPCATIYIQIFFIIHLENYTIYTIIFINIQIKYEHACAQWVFLVMEIFRPVFKRWYFIFVFSNTIEMQYWHRRYFLWTMQISLYPIGRFPSRAVFLLALLLHRNKNTCKPADIKPFNWKPR